MKKRFKLRKQSGKITILRWQSEGVLFGPQWEGITTFDNAENNLERCKAIIRLMNECDEHTNTINDNDKK